MILEEVRTRLESAFEWIDHRTGGIPRILKHAVQRFDQMRGAEAAASIAYFAIFSLFPLLLFLVAVTGFLLAYGDSSQVLDVIIQIFPVAHEQIGAIYFEILERRGAGGIIGLVGLLWAASGVFQTLARSINRAWPGASMRSFVQGRLLAVLMTTVLAVLLTLWFISNTLLNLLPALQIPLLPDNGRYETLLWSVARQMTPWFISFLGFVALYRWLPNTRVEWSEAIWSALVVAIAWQLTTAVFTWFLGSGLASFEILYGSLGAILALLTWIYLSSLIVIFGAHLSAAIAFVKRVEKKAEER